MILFTEHSIFTIVMKSLVLSRTVFRMLYKSCGSLVNTAFLPVNVTTYTLYKLLIQCQNEVIYEYILAFAGHLGSGG